MVFGGGTEPGIRHVTSVREPVRSIRQSPHDPAVWMVALQNGGVRVSSGGLFNWGQSSISRTIYEAEFHPTDPDVLYAGGWNTGLMVSGDRGESWSRLEGLEADNIHGIAVSRRDPDHIFVGSMDDGVFISSDAGATWRPAAPEIFGQGQIWDIHIRGE